MEQFSLYTYLYIIAKSSKRVSGRAASTPIRARRHTYTQREDALAHTTKREIIHTYTVVHTHTYIVVHTLLCITIQ